LRCEIMTEEKSWPEKPATTGRRILKTQHTQTSLLVCE
jgi:hypothetical protein